jgi:hypothetical protein
MPTDKRVVYEKWPKGTLLRVDAELMGGSLLETLEPAEGTHKVKLSAGAFEALKALRNRGETVQNCMERLIFAAEHDRTIHLPNSKRE